MADFSYDFSHIRDDYAHHILRNYQKNRPITVPVSGIQSGNLMIPPQTGPLKIGILGAGVSGLFAALILQAAIDKSVVEGTPLNITYEILEVEAGEGEHPYGGRLWTKSLGGGKNDYYDRGVMRFPDVPFAKPVSYLLEYLSLHSSRIEYIMSTNNNLRFYNNRRLTKGQIAANAQIDNHDPFKTNVTELSATPEDMLQGKIQPLVDGLIENKKKGKEFLRKLDREGYATRSYLSMTEPKYNNDVINYLETFTAGTTSFDQSLYETVMSELAFHYPGHHGKSDAKWFCIHCFRKAWNPRFALAKNMKNPPNP
ncbi:hypothetical protein OF83DRAFT_1085776 [Amylostereum chailletii]|nr:hypothetical protein OF83DRAFT_1085776 [Amylostereum chailletii]